MLNETLQELVNAAVARGADLLDKHRPTWRNDIKAKLIASGKALHLTAFSHCVIGILYSLEKDRGEACHGTYKAGLVALGIKPEEDAYYGFTASTLISGEPGGWDALTNTWLSEIHRSDFVGLAPSSLKSFTDEELKQELEARAMKQVDEIKALTEQAIDAARKALDAATAANVYGKKYLADGLNSLELGLSLIYTR